MQGIPNCRLGLAHTYILCYRKEGGCAMLKVGQKLWYYDPKERNMGYVLVANLYKDGFDVWYNGKRVKRPYAVIGKKLHTTPAKAKLAFAPQDTKRNAPFYQSKKKPKDRNPPKAAPYRPSAEHLLKTGKSCDRCALRKSGECSRLTNEVCEDYRALQFISRAEADYFPEYGDAVAIRKRDRKHFKD